MRKYILFAVILMALSFTGCPKASAPTPPLPPTTVPPVTQPPVVSVPPAVVYSLNDIQNTLAKTCGTCGNTGGSSNSASAVYNQLMGIPDAPTPNSNRAAEFNIAANVPYANGYWYWPHSDVMTQNETIIYDFFMYVPAASLTATQAIEWEYQVTLNNQVYNFAVQLERRNGVFKTFDYINKKWIATTIKTSEVSPDAWHHFIQRGTINKDKTGTINSLTVDYSVHDISVTRPSLSRNGTNHFTNAFQLDSNGKTPPTPYKVYVDRMRITHYANTN